MEKFLYLYCESCFKNKNYAAKILIVFTNLTAKNSFFQMVLLVKAIADMIINNATTSATVATTATSTTAVTSATAVTVATSATSATAVTTATSATVTTTATTDITTPTTTNLYCSTVKLCH